MIPRGSGRRVASIVLLVGVVVVVATLLASRRPSSAAGTANPATSTLTLALPGPFDGCSILNPAVTESSAAILDLIRPSAFLVGPSNVLTGEGGALVSAELVSLHPETVVYSIDPQMKWSDGRPFSVNDLIAWWRSARQLQSISSVGYRSITSMVVNKARTTVTATFGVDFADWNLLFHDVEHVGASSSCDVHRLLQEPSLGPYLVRSASPGEIILVSNTQWTSNLNRFHRIIITASSVLPRDNVTYFVGYRPVATQALVTDLVAHPRYLGQFAHASDIEELTFSPRMVTTSLRPVRTALAQLIDRKAILNRLFGSFTSSPTVPTSALFSQGQLTYPSVTASNQNPGSSGNTIDPSKDCRTCAFALLRRAGYVITHSGWRHNGGPVLSVQVAVGPTPLDHLTAGLVDQQWSTVGVHVSLIDVYADADAAMMAANGSVDVALFDRPTSTTPWTTAQSWSHSPYRDSYPTGLTSHALQQLFVQAQAIFNPSTAITTWLVIDHMIMNNFWVRPLYTVPSLIEFSGRVANVASSLSLNGFVDELTNWGIVQPTASNSTTTAATSIG